MRTVVATAILVTTLWGCSSKNNGQVTDSTTRVENLSDAVAVTKIASDKELLRQAILEASNRGTLGEAVSAAAADSGAAAKMRAALMAPANVSRASSESHTSSSRGSATTAQKKDVLDKANESLNKADQTVTKSGEVINKAQDVSKKAGDILHGRR
jgi:hypothetical protein